VQTQTQLLLDNLVNTPAMVLGRCFDVLAWNSLAAALFVDFNQERYSDDLITQK